MPEDNDGLSNSDIKELRIPVPILTEGINLSFCSGIFPDILKIMIVIPLHKNVLKNEMGNYRPISLLPDVGKIMETCVKKHLMTFPEKREVFEDYQYCFRKRKSVDQALLCT